MKSFSILALASLAAVSIANAGPHLDIADALKIAKQTLKERNLDGEVWVRSIALESTSIAGSSEVWVVSWNAPVSLEENKRETGLAIKMDGTYARYVDKQSVTPGTAGVPAGRAPLGNHRTRSKRPSILDLKH